MDAPLPLNLVPAWEAFFATHGHLKGEALRRAVFDDGLLFPLQRYREMELVLKLALTVGVRRVCEVGSDKGGSVLCWATLPTIENVTAVEIRGTPYGEVFTRYFRGNPTFQFSGPIGSAVAAVALRTSTFDVVFLDGDKGRFLEDFHAYRPLVRPGGLVLLHDVQDPSPMREAFEEIGKTYETSVILDTSECDEPLARQAAGVPPQSSHEGWIYTWGRTSCSCGVVRIP